MIDEKIILVGNVILPSAVNKEVKSKKKTKKIEKKVESTFNELIIKQLSEVFK